MKPERWEEVKRLYHAALERNVAERPAFLEEIGARDPVLRDEVESLLGFQTEADGFIQSPALELVARGLAQDRKNFLIGKQFGTYRVISLLGVGGMGEVYLAEDSSLQRRVALKFLSEDFRQDEVARQRFLREARSAAALDHPFICNVHEIGEVDQMDYISMEYVQGRTLQEELKQGPLAPQRALQLANEIAEALDKAHQSEIVHRDLKPANVMLTQDGHVKVMDFGLAKRMTSKGSGQEITQNSLTREGQTLGTVPYMSPEQVKGQAADQRSDIFCFGVMLYEMLAGAHPFKKTEPMETAVAILHQDPQDLDQRNRQISPALAAIVRRMLQKDPELRYSSVRQIRADLSGLLEGAPRIADFRSRERAWRPGWIGTLVLAGIVFGGWSVWKVFPTGDAPPIAPLEITPITFSGGTKNYPRISPDGTKVAYEWNGPDRDNVDIYVKPIAEDTDVLRITDHPALDGLPEWSPDGQRLAFVRLSLPKAIYTIPALGGVEKKLIELEGPAGQPGKVIFNFLSWSPDGNWIAYSEKPSLQLAARIQLVNVNTLEKRPLADPPPEPAALGDLAPRFSPDGRQIAFVRSSSDVGNQDIWIQDLETGNARQVTSEQYEVCDSISWLAKGTGLVFSAGRVGSMRTYRLDLRGDARPRPVVGLGGNEDQATLAGNRLVFLRHTSNSPMQVWQAPGRLASNRSASSSELIRSPGNDTVLAVSPDGTRLAFVSSRSERNQIWLVDRDGSNPRQLTNMETDAYTPSWSPDGRWISFEAQDPGNNDVYTVEIETGRVQQMTVNEATDAGASFSRDGRSLYFSSSRSGSDQIWKMPIQGGVARRSEARQITRVGGFFGIESWDGEFFYYVDQLFGPTLWRVPSEGGEEVEVLSGELPLWRSWDLASGGIYFQRMKKAPESGQLQYGVSYLDLKTRRTTEIFSEPVSGGYMWLAVSPDEEAVFFSKWLPAESDLVLAENFH